MSSVPVPDDESRHDESRHDASPTRRQQQARDTRERVLLAALQVFSETGFVGARVQDVAKRAGVALGTIYHHFDSKEALGNAVYRRWKAATREYAIDVHASRPAREAFSEYWHLLSDFHRDHPAAFIFVETQHHSPYLDAQSIELARRIDRAALEAIDAWQTEGAVKRGDPEVVVAMIVGVFASLVRETTRLGKSVDDAVLAFGESCAWDMVCAPAA